MTEWFVRYLTSILLLAPPNAGFAGMPDPRRPATLAPRGR